MKKELPGNIKGPNSFPGNRGALIALLLLSLTGFIVFKDYLLFHKVYLFKKVASDSLNYVYPYLCEVCDSLSQYGLPQWSFRLGMGQSIFPFILRDPFYLFLYIAGKNHIAYILAYNELAKVVLGGFIFYYYLKTLALSGFVAVAGSLLFAFCGFMIVGGCWYIFSFSALNMAFLLLSFELLFTKRKWYLFPFPIFLICISQPFNLYLYGIFLIVYTLLRLVQTKSLSVKNTISIFLRMAGAAMTGILLSAPFFIENILQLAESPRGSGASSYSRLLSSVPVFGMAGKFEIGTALMRFFSNDIIGTGHYFNGAVNYLEAPMFYCGLPCLLLMPQLFKFLGPRVRLFFAVILILWLLPVFFPYFRYAFWLFTGDYYRDYSLFVAFFLLYYSLFALDFILKRNEVSLLALAVTLMVLLAALHYPFFSNKQLLHFEDRQTPDPAVSGIVSIMLLLYAIILYLVGKYRSLTYLKYLFLALVVFELSYFSHITVNNMDAVNANELKQRTGFNDYSVEAIDKIKRPDSSFYRIDKTYFSTPAVWFSLNDAMAQGYMGTSAYYSFNQQYYILYLQLMGISNKSVENESRWAWGLVGRPILESENQVKYILTKTVLDSFRKMTCDSITAFKDVTLLKNKFALPFGYSYDYYIRESIFSGLSNQQKDLVSLKACVLKDGATENATAMHEYLLKDTLPAVSFDTGKYRQWVNELKKDTLTISRLNENIIAGNISLSSNKMIYLSVPYDDGWLLTVDGQRRDKIILSAGMTGVMLTKGRHSIEMNYHLRYLQKGLLLSALGLLLYVGLLFFDFNRKKRHVQLSKPR
jgi:uncharacterized membrane protein YfhO